MATTSAFQAEGASSILATRSSVFIRAGVTQNPLSKSTGAHSGCKTHYDQETSGYVPPYPLASGQEKSWTSEEDICSCSPTAEAIVLEAIKYQFKSVREHQLLTNGDTILYFCERCGKAVFEKFGSGRFCSAKCSHSRAQTQETRDKISASNKGQPATDGSFKVGHKGVGDRNLAAQKAAVTRKANRDARSYDELSTKEQVLYSQSNRCNCCGIREWQGKPIVLELHHRDGNHYNNARDNLEYLCPNCHSQTDTWRMPHKYRK